MPGRTSSTPTAIRAAIRRSGVAAAWLAAACMSAAAPASARTLQQVLNVGQVRVGVVIAAPWALRNSGGELDGFEIDVAKRLAADLEVQPDFVIYRFDELVPAIESGEVDIIVSGLTITPERARHVNFSRPYATGGITIATNTNATSAVGRFEDLNSDVYRIGAVGGSVAAELAARMLPGAKLTTFGSPAEAADALVGGDIDAYLDEEPAPTFLALEHPDVVDVPIARPLLETRSAFAVAKGDPDFLAYLNAWIEAREADTWLTATHQYWFETLRWRDR